MTSRISTRCDEQGIDDLFAAVDQSHLPGAVVGVAIDGVPVYRKGFGLANMELPTLLTPAMRLRIGSTTKHFTALAYMLLCEEGLAGIDDEIGQHVPGLQPVTARATLRRLMGHTSGVRDLLSVTMLFNGLGRPVTDQEMLAYYASIEDADFEPDARWSYNNGGYILLSAAIERITGQRLDDVLRERIFEPVGMHGTLLRRWDTDFVPNSASLHFRDAAGHWSRTGMGMEISGAGGIVSTVDDMLLWLKHMRAPVVGAARTWQLMREPQRLRSGHSTGYGLGLIAERYRGVDVIHHAGTVIGGNSQMITVPDAGLDIFIAANRSDVSAIALACAVIDACVEGLDPAPASVPRVPRTGTFVCARDGRLMTLTAAGDQQLLSLDGASPMPVAPDDEGVLRLPASHAFLQQSVRIDGEGIAHGDFGNEERFEEIEAEPEARLGAYAGAYRCEAVDTTMDLRESDGEAQALSHGRHGSVVYRLMPVAAGIWRIEDRLTGMLSAALSFDADGRGFSLDSGRLRQVRFRKFD